MSLLRPICEGFFLNDGQRLSKLTAGKEHPPGVLWCAAIRPTGRPRRIWWSMPVPDAVPGRPAVPAWFTSATEAFDDALACERQRADFAGCDERQCRRQHRDSAVTVI